MAFARARTSSRWAAMREPTYVHGDMRGERIEAGHVVEVHSRYEAAWLRSRFYVVEILNGVPVCRLERAKPGDGTAEIDADRLRFVGTRELA